MVFLSTKQLTIKQSLGSPFTKREVVNEHGYNFSYLMDEAVYFITYHIS